jgi:REP element-mobilizing transposase RayT
MPTNRRIFTEEQQPLRTAPVVLDPTERALIESAIREVCEHRRYVLRAVNARSNHVHSVVSASTKPEHIMDSFKAYATRKLREQGILASDVKPWSRHGSTPYLWTEEDVARAVDYVLNGQGDEPFRSKG